MRGRRKLALAVLAIAFALPTAVAIRPALADEEEPDESEPEQKATRKGGPKGPALSPEELAKRRRKILDTLTTDENVLINVSTRELPASPDILNLGRRGAKALARCVSDNVDDGMRSACASMLAKIGDRVALPALQGALEAWDPHVRGAAIEALRAMPDPSSYPGLSKLLGREDEETSNRFLAVRALGALSYAPAVKDLRRMLREAPGDHGDLAVPAFEGIWRSRALLSRAALVDDVAFALRSGRRELVLPAAYASSELRAEGLVPALIPLMQNPDVRVRNRAVFALGKIGSPSATTALVAQIPKVRESRMLNNIAFALERLDPRSFYGTAKGLSEHKQASIRMNTAFVLGDVRRADGLGLLSKALGDQNDFVRVSAVAALGKLDTKEAAPIVERYLDDPNPSLREEAIYSAHALSGGKRSDLLFDKLYSSPRQDTKHRALLALSQAADPRVGPDLLACFENRQCPVDAVDAYVKKTKLEGAAGRLLIQWVRGRTELTELLGQLKPPGGAPLAMSAAEASLAHGDRRGTASALDLFADLGDTSGRARVLEVSKSESVRLRLHGLVAASRLGGVAEDAKIFAEIDNLAQIYLPHASTTLGHVAEPAVRARLLPEIERRKRAPDFAMRAAMANVHLAWDGEAGLPRVLELVGSKEGAERDLALRYLQRDRRAQTTWLLRRALAREGRPEVRDLLRRLVDARGPGQE